MVDLQMLDIKHFQHKNATGLIYWVHFRENLLKNENRINPIKCLVTIYPNAHQISTNKSQWLLFSIAWAGQWADHQATRRRFKSSLQSNLRAVLVRNYEKHADVRCQANISKTCAIWAVHCPTISCSFSQLQEALLCSGNSYYKLGK